MEYNKVLVFVTLLYISVIADELENETELSPFSEPSEQTTFLGNVEVPDSSLLLLDRLNFTRRPTISYRSRNKQKPQKVQKQATTTVITTNTTTPLPTTASTYRSRKKQKPQKVQKQGTTTVITTNTTTPLPTTASSEEDEEELGPLRPCTCSQGICKCCTGFLMGLFNQKACMRITYHPGDFAFDVAMSWNDRVLYENSLSGKNPKPICIHPPRMNNLKVCAKFYNVFFPGRNFHFCLAMNGQWRSYELFNVAFNCLRMGANGIAMMRPEDAGGLVIPNPQGGVDAVIDSGDDIEDYDENVVKSLLDIFDRKK